MGIFTGKVSRVMSVGILRWSTGKAIFKVIRERLIERFFWNLKHFWEIWELFFGVI